MVWRFASLLRPEGMRVLSKLEKLMALHVGSPSPSVPLQLPVDPLMNTAHCQAIAEHLVEIGGVWEQRKATQTLWREIPACKGLYMFVWRPSFSFHMAHPQGSTYAPSSVIYIGQAGYNSSNTLRQRYKSEYSKYLSEEPAILWEEVDRETRADRLRRYLQLRPLEYWYTEIDDPASIKTLESALLRMFRPVVNRIGLVRLKETEAFSTPKKKDS